jgi:hypothetical protein
LNLTEFIGDRSPYYTATDDDYMTHCFFEGLIAIRGMREIILFIPLCPFYLVPNLPLVERLSREAA